MPLILALRSSASFRPVVVSTGQHQAMVVEVFALAGITPEVFVTGNTGIDALQWAAGLDVAFTDPRLAEIDESGDRVVLVTGHRRENWGGGLQRIGEGVALAARAHPDVHFVLPMHPNPRVRAELTPPLEDVENVLLIEALGYASSARLIKRCHFAITDSGGIQEEAPSFGKPVLVTRDSTERTEGVEAGTLRLVGTDSATIAGAASMLLDDEAMATAENRSTSRTAGSGRRSGPSTVAG